MTREMLTDDALPFLRMDNIRMENRGKLPEQHFTINGVKVTFSTGDFGQRARLADLVVVPRSQKGHLTAYAVEEAMEPYYADSMAVFPRVFHHMKMGVNVGKIVPTRVVDDEQTTSTAQMILNAVTIVPDEQKDQQFNIIRGAVSAIGQSAYHLSDEDGDMRRIAMPALGTDFDDHLKGYQSARAIFSGISDFSKQYEQDVSNPVHFDIVIPKNNWYAPMIDEFKQVMDDVSFQTVGVDGEKATKKQCAKEEKYTYRVLLAYGLSQV